MKKSITILCLFWSTLLSCTQQAAKANWRDYHIPGVCSFAIPSSLVLKTDDLMFKAVELPEGKRLYEWNNSDKDLFAEGFKFVFAPSNIKKEVIESNDRLFTYPLISLSFSRNSHGERFMQSLTNEQIKSMENYSKGVFGDGFRDAARESNQLVKGTFVWQPMRVSKVNNVPCVSLGMKRPGYNSACRELFYQFDKGYYHITLRISYCYEEDATLIEMLNNIIKYLQFEEPFVKGLYKSSPIRHTTFKSNRYNLQWVYDAAEFESEYESSTLLTLQSRYYDVRALRLYAHDGRLIPNNNIYDTELKDFFIEREMKDSNVQNTLISSCQEVIIGANIRALRSISHTNGSIEQYNIVYRFSNDSELQMIILSLSNDEYDKLDDIEKDVLTGLSYIK